MLLSVHGGAILTIECSKYGPRVDTCRPAGSTFLWRKTGLSHVLSVCCDSAWALIGGQEVILKTFFVLIFEHTSCVA